MTFELLKEFLEEKYQQYHCTEFIESDPVSIPHLFSRKQDIEIAGFLSATLSWGQRSTIIRNARKLMSLMDNSPYDFIRHSSSQEMDLFNNFVHRTFNELDCRYFITALKEIYSRYHGLETIFSEGYEKGHSIKAAIIEFRRIFLSFNPDERTRKHLANPERGSSAKRINMFLRWMVRPTDVDFGIWKTMPISALMIPIDVHSGNVSRKLQLLQRKQNDWKAVEELTAMLRRFDPTDPVKYDYALFGLGVFEKF